MSILFISILSLEDAGRQNHPKTKVIIPVHFGGHPCRMNSVLELAATKGLTVVEDAAHAIPAKYRGQNIGNTESHDGHLVFMPPRLSRPARAEWSPRTTTRLRIRVSLMRLHGMSRDAWKRYTAAGNLALRNHGGGVQIQPYGPQAALGLVLAAIQLRGDVEAPGGRK